MIFLKNKRLIYFIITNIIFKYLFKFILKIFIKNLYMYIIFINIKN